MWAFVAVPGVAWVAVAPDVYRSESRLFVRLGRENVTVDPAATIGQGVLSTVPPSREADVNSIVEILKSRALAERTVDRLTPEAILAPEQTGFRKFLPRGSLSSREKAIVRLSKVVTPTVLRRSNLVAVTCESGDAETARRILTTYLEGFFDQYRTLHRDPGAQEFLAEQTASMGQRLRESEEALLGAKQELGVGSIEERRRVLIQGAGALEERIAEAEAAVAEADAEVAGLETELEGLPQLVLAGRTNGFPNGAGDSMRQRVFELEMEEGDLAAKYSDSHPLLRAARDRLNEARRILEVERTGRSQSTEAPSATRDELQLAMLKERGAAAGLRARLAELRPQLAAAERKILALNDAEQRIARLDREVELRRADYLKYAESLEQVRIDRAMEADRISNVAVVQPASREGRPAKPDRPLLLGFVVAAATILAAGAAYLAEQTGFGPTPSGPSERIDEATLNDEPTVNDTRALDADAETMPRWANEDGRSGPGGNGEGEPESSGARVRTPR